MTKRVLFVVFAWVCAMCWSPVAHGQANGTFSGTVVDKSGSPIVGASITITSQGTGAVRDTKSDDVGHYLAPLLPVGIYTLHVEFSGFQSAESKDLRLQVDESREVDFTLVPSSVNATVEVTASPVAVETTNASLGQVITSQQVTQLPLNGRDFVQLATLTPGTTAETNTNSFFNGAASSEVSARGSFSLSVGGSRANSTDWLLDGNDNNELTAGGISILSSIDSIQEFKVLTYNYSAEYGYRAGPTVLVTTKNGSNDFHGSLFEFFRNTSLDAQSFFAILPEKFNLNQFGGSLGGPIRKNKTFFFLDGEQKYQRRGITFTGLLPTEAYRSGDFTDDPFGLPRPAPLAPPPPGQPQPVNANKFGPITNPNVTGGPNPYFQCDAAGNPLPAAPNGSQPAGVNCNKIPSNLLNPIAQELINLYPLPNANNPGNNYNFVNEPTRALDETKFDIRIDHNFSSTDTIFSRFSYDQADSIVPGGGGPGSFAESNAFGSNQNIINHGRNVVISETHVFSPNTVNQITGGYNRIFDYISSQGTGSCQAAIFQIPGANLDCNASNVCAPKGISCGLTSTQLDQSYWAVGDRGFSPFIGGTNVFSIGDSLDMIRGKHDIKVGLGIRANQLNVRTEGFQDGYWILTGSWTGDAEADLVLGLPSLAIHDQTFDGSTTGRRWKTYRPYVQDDWRISRNLTLNLGLAWNLTTPISEVANRYADFNPANGQFLIAGNTPFGPNAGKWVGIHFDKDALEPRIGVAWKPWGSDRTVLRAGYAIFHDSAWSQGAQGLWQNPPYYAESDAFAFVQPRAGCTFATAACATLYGQTPSGNSLSNGFQVFSAPPDPANFSGTIQSQNLNFKLGMVQQFNVNVERELPGQVVLTAGYAGSRSDHILIDGNNLNVASPTACGVVPDYTLGCGPGGTAFGVPYTEFPFSTVSNISDLGKADYNSLQLKAETKNSRHGLYALVSYTYAHTHDNGFSDGLGSNIGATYFPLPNWRKLDWGLSQINLNNNFTASVIYDLPFGHGKRFGNDWGTGMNTAFGDWQVTAIERITSGFPIFIVDSSNPSEVNFQNNGNSWSRPNEVGNPNRGGTVAANPTCIAPAQVHTLANWFNPCAFESAPFGELGDASRTPLSGPGQVNTDFSLIKQFRLPWERLGLSFRAEFFNLFNHAQFATPTGFDINGSGFGTINSTVNNPRLVQFALKLTF